MVVGGSVDDSCGIESGIVVRMARRTWLVCDVSCSWTRISFSSVCVAEWVVHARSGDESRLGGSLAVESVA